jgi:dihydrofolate reductase
MRIGLTLIAAISADGLISKGTGVPWELPIDRQHFRSYTKDRWLLIGRKTYQEMQGWFQPLHHPLVLTRDIHLSPHPGQTVHTIEQAIRLTEDAGEPELVCCGGGLVYEAAMRFANQLVITHVDHKLTQGVPFPPINPESWLRVRQQSYLADQTHPYSFEIAHYERKKPHDRGALL